MRTLENFLAVQNEMGETPIWVPEEKALYWVDIPQHTIYRYDSISGEYESFQPEVPVRALTRRTDGSWLIIANTGLAFWDRQTNSCEFLVDPCADLPKCELNDGVIDRQGRLLVGSYNTETLDAADGALYRLDSDRSLHELDTSLVLSNGMGVSPDGKILYVAEMFAYKITAYDYDNETGHVSKRRTFVDFPESDGMPDGLTVDREGCVWTAHWGGWRVTRYEPNGKLERTIRVPAEIVTSVGFGGVEMDELFITTAWYSLDEQQRKGQPQAGDLFRIKTDIKGIVEPGFSG
jgi:sugar lactone lactonase YvrE